MTKEATAAVASVLMLLALFALAQLDSTRGFAFRRSHQTPTSAPTLDSADVTTTTPAGATPCEPSPAQ